MKRKRMIKLLMSFGCDRNAAARAADMCDGSNSHVRVLNGLCMAFLREYCKQMDAAVVKGDMTGAIAGVVGSVYG